MARPSVPNQRKLYKDLEKRIRSYTLLIEDIYDSLAEEAASIALSTGFDIDSKRPFSFSDYPNTAARVEDLQRRMVDEIEAVIYNGTASEWEASNEAQDLLATGVLREYDAAVDGQKYRILYQTNSDALRAFQQRVDKGMTISDKLWNQSISMTTAMEEAISCAIQKGMSAITLSKRISKYLNDYPKLAADYGKKYGSASKAGDCEYRSIRLAASEINMAYRNAENERWAQMDFVVGYEIRLSSNHNCKGIPRGRFYDICDELAGKYPKDFKWSGWHPLCRCYKIPILKTEEEFWEWDGRNEISTSSVNEVKDVPDNFKKWINNNIQRAKSWESTPYFIRDNKDFIREDFKVNVYNKTEKLFVRKRRTNLAMSRVEYYNKTYPYIPEVQQAAVNAYTQPIEATNRGATSREINRRLRSVNKDSYVDAASKLISQALAKLPKYVGVVYRGETMSMAKLHERFLGNIGKVISDKGFVSSSRYMDTPMKFISHDGIPKSHKRVIFEIYSKNGRDISRISEFNGIFNSENQHEILFDKGTKFLLPDIPRERDGIMYIKLIEQ